MTIPQRQRILASWLNHVAIPYIAKVEGITIAEVQAVIAKAARQPRRTMQL